MKLIAGIYKHYDVNSSYTFDSLNEMFTKNVVLCLSEWKEFHGMKCFRSIASSLSHVVDVINMKCGTDNSFRFISIRISSVNRGYVRHLRCVCIRIK